MYSHIHNFCEPLSSLEIIYFLFMGFELILYIISCQGENQNILTNDFNNEYTKYALASKATKAVYLNPNFQ